MDLLRGNPRYIIDTSSLIELRDRYNRVFAPGAWDTIESLADGGVIASAEDVFEELATGDDLLLAWAKTRRFMFVPLSADVQLLAKRILKHYPDLLDLKRRASSADPFVIATAEFFGATVVTEEGFSGPGHRPHIPNVCKALGINCIRIRELFVAEGVRLVVAS